MKKILFIALTIIVVIIGIVLLSQSDKDSDSISDNSLKSISEITHGHGLALTADNKLYIATHHGLLLLENDKDLYPVGDKQDDYMGFSPHPTDSKIFFSSGHPAIGGNIGFQKSEDGGLTWKKISDGLNGPVDFHAMTISPANSDLVYGSYQGAVQRSIDGGKNWEKFPVNFIIVNFTADPNDENVVYAASPQGLFVSKDKGQTWDKLTEAGNENGFVSTVIIDPQNSLRLIAYAEDKGLIESIDGGKKWNPINQGFEGGTPLYIAFNKAVPNTGYILTEQNSIYKTINDGASWNKIR